MGIGYNQLMVRVIRGGHKENKEILVDKQNKNNIKLSKQKQTN